MLSMREVMNAWHNFMTASFDMYRFFGGVCTIL